MRVGPKYKIARRLGERIFSKTQTTKFTVSGTEKRGSGKRPKRAPSEFGRQLIEKQKVRYTYNISEKQLSNYVKKARTVKGGNPVNELYKKLESRLDNVVFRLGLANSRAFARQLVSHGHITLNGRKTNIPSCEIKPGDVIAVRKGSYDKGPFKEEEKDADVGTVPNWLVYEASKKEGKVKSEPVIDEKGINLNFRQVLEFYSRV